MERLAVPVRTSSPPRPQLERIPAEVSYFLCIDCGFTVFSKETVGAKHVETEIRLAEKLGDPVGACLHCKNPTSRWVGPEFGRVAKT